MPESSRSSEIQAPHATIVWTEVSAPGAALKIDTAPIPEPFKTRIAYAVESGSGTPPTAPPTASK